ncbi:Short-chain dehydrogenase [Bryocella elongata]|uniref:Short-chain dehydrogenase n=1 Tax=Bryocella elongata TaxID=863522 RepID=A0A1H6C0U6_9BACT|nr:SDR family oxidoreductase [Bryocella elongata]SEG66590.1 Short-chain dehydrogenase [Bryocella elongata]
MSTPQDAIAGTEGRKVALVSGANKGLGFETARQLGRMGYIVYVGSRDAMKGEIAARRMRAEGIDARVLKLDVTKQSDIDAAAKKIGAECGVLDALVNNAGVMHEKSWTVNSTSATDMTSLRATYEANVFAVVAVTQAMLPLLRKSAAGRIVNVSSILGSVSLQATPGSPTYATKLFAYNSSKAALNMFTISLAHELRNTKIKVNSAHPGWVKTDLGGDAAPLNAEAGAKTEVELATLPEDGPTGGFFHDGKPIAW